MSQPAQSQYGRPGQPQYGHPLGGYAPQGPPAQQGPGRYYPQGPQGQLDPRDSLVLSLIKKNADSRTPQPQNPPQNGPQQSQYSPNDPRNRTTSGNPPPQPSSDPFHHRPISTYDNPQELGTYTSPTDGRPQSYLPPPTGQQPLTQHQQPNEYSPSVYSPSDEPSQPYHGGQQPFSQGPPAQHQPPSQAPPAPQPAQQQQQQPYQAPQPPYPTQQQPAHQPPPVPSPNLQSPYPVLNSGPPQGGYQPYRAPEQAQHAAGGPDDFYR